MKMREYLKTPVSNQKVKSNLKLIFVLIILGQLLTLATACSSKPVLMRDCKEVQAGLFSCLPQ